MPQMKIEVGGGSKSKTSKTVGSTFDSQSYLSQLEGSVGEGSLEQGGSPIRTMAEFRKHVISSKKLGQNSASMSMEGGDSLTQESGMGQMGNSQASGGFELSHQPR